MLRPGRRLLLPFSFFPFLFFSSSFFTTFVEVAKPISFPTISYRFLAPTIETLPLPIPLTVSTVSTPNLHATRSAYCFQLETFLLPLETGCPPVYRGFYPLPLDNPPHSFQPISGPITTASLKKRAGGNGGGNSIAAFLSKLDSFHLSRPLINNGRIVTRHLRAGDIHALSLFPDLFRGCNFVENSREPTRTKEG